eukprot:828-Heterococcus_DN1.PRE.2
MATDSPVSLSTPLYTQALAPAPRELGLRLYRARNCCCGLDQLSLWAVAARSAAKAATGAVAAASRAFPDARAAASAARCIRSMMLVCYAARNSTPRALLWRRHLSHSCVYEIAFAELFSVRMSDTVVRVLVLLFCCCCCRGCLLFVTQLSSNQIAVSQGSKWQNRTSRRQARKTDEFKETFQFENAEGPKGGIVQIEVDEGRKKLIQRVYSFFVQCSNIAAELHQAASLLICLLDSTATGAAAVSPFASASRTIAFATVAVGISATTISARQYKLVH